MGDWAGAIAVVFTLVYLGRQIDINAKQFRQQIETNMSDRVYRAYDPVYSGRNAEILYTGLYEPEVLTKPDAFVFDLLLRRHGGAIHNVASLYRKGEIDRQAVDSMARHYQNVFLSTPGGKSWFQEHVEEFEETLSVMGLMDALMETTEQVS